jgi:peroxin-5
MSLQGLMSGADCAVESNPLSQVMKHTEGDRSLQQDRIAGPSSSRVRTIPTLAQYLSIYHISSSCIIYLAL